MASDQPVPAQNLEEKRNYEKWASGRRKELRIAALAAALILLGTIYFGGLNAYLLYREAPEPFHVAVTQPAGADIQAEYRVTVSWQPMEGPSRIPIRPSVLVHGIAVPLASARPSPSDPRFRTGESAELDFVVGGDCTPGVHEGWISLQKVSGSPDAQTTLTSPIKVQVIGGLWRRWYLLRDWLIASFGLLALLYAFFFSFSQVPSGEISVEYHDGRLNYPPAYVALRARRLALLMPWKRPALPLAPLFKKAGVPACGFAGEIVFKMRNHPALFLAPAAADRVYRLFPGAVFQPGQPLQSCGPVEVVWDKESFVAFAEVRNRPPYMVMHYKAW